MAAHVAALAFSDKRASAEKSLITSSSKELSSKSKEWITLEIVTLTPIWNAAKTILQVIVNILVHK